MHLDDRAPSAAGGESSTSSLKHSSNDLLASEWAQVQSIQLVNDGTGLGFGIIGARTAGVIVKTILVGGVADRDGRLLSGDHILQIGDVNLHDMGSEQVASVLRQSGTHVRLVVARPVDPMNVSQEGEGSAIVPARLLSDPGELERYLIAAGYPDIFGVSSTPSTPLSGTTTGAHFTYPNELHGQEIIDLPETERFIVELTKDNNGLGITIAGWVFVVYCFAFVRFIAWSGIQFQFYITRPPSIPTNSSLLFHPSSYVCEKEELSGIFVKSVSPGSAADVSGRIQVNDRIIEVDSQSLQGYSNHQAVEVLKKSGQVVTLCLERYLRGPKYDQLQQAIAANELKPSTPSTPPHLPMHPPPPLPPLSTRPTTTTMTMTTALHDLSTEESMDDPTVMAASRKLVLARDSLETRGQTEYGDESSTDHPFPMESAVDDDEDEEDGNVPNINQVVNARTVAQHKYYVEPVLTAELESSIRGKWQALLGPSSEVKVIVAQIRKFSPTSGLGISLEGTVDVEGGREVRPHHYIRSILPEGPVGKNGLLQSADELLEVNGQRLLGLNHLEVVAILKELPQDVRMVCGREQAMVPFTEENICNSLGIDVAAMKAANLDGSGSSVHGGDRLVKAKSDGSLATGSVGAGGTEESFMKIKSRSLEPLTGLAMWSSEPQIIELIKGERGLGFSILDYQDPINSNDTLIVIRSLVPGGVAQLDGRLIPGDRLLFVNEMNLENASLDQAVQALKGAPKGGVRIGVAKPLPMAADASMSTGGATMMDGELVYGQSSYIEKILSNGKQREAMHGDWQK